MIFKGILLHLGTLCAKMRRASSHVYVHARAWFGR